MNNSNSNKEVIVTVNEMDRNFSHEDYLQL